MAIKITSISISRKGYQKDSPFVAKVATSWDDKDNVMSVEVDEQRTLAIINLIAPLITDACRGEMDSFARLAAEAVAPQIEARSQSVEEDDDIPF
jgi:hypothetical protein